MTGPVVVGAAFLAALIAFSFVIGAPILAIPLVLIALGVLGAGELRRRRRLAQDLSSHREQAQAESVDFTARDKETLT